MTKRRRKKMLILSLAITMIFMGIGYALLSKNLDVTLTSESNGRWDIRIDTINVKAVSGNAVSRSFTHNGLTATFAVDLFTTGDYVEYEVKVKNFGNIPAKLASKTPTYTDTSGVIGFTDDATIDEILAPGASKVITVKISVDSSSSEDILNATYSLTLVYSQFTTSPPSYDASSYPGGGGSTPVDNTKKLRLLSASGYPEITSENISSLDLGDLIGFGTSDIASNEQFYIIDGDGSSYVVLLSRYLLNVGPHQKTTFGSGERDTRGLQDKNVGYAKTRSTSAINAELTSTGGFMTGGYLYGTVAFSNSNSWWDSENETYESGYQDGSNMYQSSLIKPYVDAYVSTLTSMGLGTAFANIVGVTPTIIGGILDVNYVGTLCNASISGGLTSVSNCPSYLFTNTYWLSDIYQSEVYGIVSAGSISGNNTVDMVTHDDYNTNFAVGIRPVIAVALSS